MLVELDKEDLISLLQGMKIKQWKLSQSFINKGYAYLEGGGFNTPVFKWNIDKLCELSEDNIFSIYAAIKESNNSVIPAPYTHSISKEQLIENLIQFPRYDGLLTKLKQRGFSKAVSKDGSWDVEYLNTLTYDRVVTLYLLI